MNAEERHRGDHRRYWDEFAELSGRYRTVRAYYRQRLAEIYRFLIPPGMRVLELGCGSGDLLASLAPARGVGVDFSPRMLDQARARHPQFEFIEADIHQFTTNEKFDFIIASDVVNDLWDVQEVFDRIQAYSEPSTRIVLNTWSRLWETPRRIAETMGLARPQLQQNWLTREDLTNLFYLSGFEVIRTFSETMWPLRTPVVDTVCNRYLVKFGMFQWLGLTNFLVARPSPRTLPFHPIVSVIVPARNEAGNIRAIFDQTPELGAGTELLFVEGRSTDDTYTAIEREIAQRPTRAARLFRQSGVGKGDAVRLGFAEASGDLFMILDADLSVSPADLSRFYEAWHSGRGEFINGVRLIYPREDHAMRFLNMVANKLFGMLFSRLLGQSVRDTLCGTKVLSRRHYEMIARNRSYFGEIDPFGDFDLLLGAAKYNLKITDLPVRYRERTYGSTNIKRWRHGWLLFRMTWRAFKRLLFV